jgi:peptide/nickel transport system permease protein
VSLFAFVRRRALYAVPQFLGMTIIVFVILRLAPGSPVDYYLATNPYATKEYIAALEERMGLRLPLWQQYARWVGGLVQGDLGESLSHPGKPVSHLLRDKVRNSLILSLTANLLSVAIAIPVGVLAAARRGTAVDGLVRLFTLFGYSMPSFWLALLLIQVFTVRLRLLPSAGFITVPEDAPFADVLIDGARHAVLPVLVLALLGAALTSRMVRSSMLEVLGDDYIRTARAKGLRERRVVYGHALRNGLLPVVTILGLQVGYLLASAAVTETVFAWPGVGREVIQATYTRDYPVIMGITVIVGSTLIVVNLLTDVLYSRLDPRIRYQ